MYDFLIVGQGIAGSILSYTLSKAGKELLVIDSGNMSSCSAVAAGLFNPITGKRMTKSWNAGKLFPLVHSFYPQMEKDLEVNFFHPMTIYRPFGTIEEQNHWISHSDSGEDSFVKTQLDYEKMLKDYIHNKFGGFETLYSGWLDVRKMMEGVKKKLQQKNNYVEEQFNFNDLVSEKGFVNWKGISAKRIIFCEGFRAINNPYFKWIPYSPSKGEVIIVRIEDFPQDLIINKNLFIVPIGDKTYKVGATFDRTTDCSITTKGKEELIERLSAIIKVPFEVIDHQAGVRPSVPDRRPLIGVHPENENLFLFNGLGTKGISLAPYYSIQLNDYLDGKRELDQEVNIRRYYSLYFRK